MLQCHSPIRRVVVRWTRESYVGEMAEALSLRLSTKYHVAIVQKTELMEESVHLGIRLMNRPNNGNTLFHRELAESSNEVYSSFRVQARRRFVKKEKPWVGEQLAGANR